MNNFNDVIIGISTPFAKGAISIIRLSGSGAIEMVNKIFKGKNLNKVNSHTIHYGHIIEKETKEILDEVLVSVFKAPKTYTKEDVHGVFQVSFHSMTLLQTKEHIEKFTIMQ